MSNSTVKTDTVKINEDRDINIIRETIMALDPKVIESLEDLGHLYFSEKTSNLLIKDLYITQDLLNQITTYWYTLHVAWYCFNPKSTLTTKNVERNLIAQLKTLDKDFSGSTSYLIECIKAKLAGLTKEEFENVLDLLYKETGGWGAVYTYRIQILNCKAIKDVELKAFFVGYYTIEIIRSDIKELELSLLYKLSRYLIVNALMIVYSNITLGINDEYVKFTPHRAYTVKNSTFCLQTDLQGETVERQAYNYYELARYLSAFLCNKPSDLGRLTPLQTINPTVTNHIYTTIYSYYPPNETLGQEEYQKYYYNTIRKYVMKDIQKVEADCIGRVKLYIKENVLEEKPELWQLLHTCIGKYLVIDIKPLDVETTTLTTQTLQELWSFKTNPEALGINKVFVSLDKINMGSSKVVLTSKNASILIERRRGFAEMQGSEVSFNRLTLGRHLWQPINTAKLKKHLNDLIGVGNYYIDITSTIELLKGCLQLTDSDDHNNFKDYLVSMLTVDSISYWLGSTSPAKS